MPNTHHHHFSGLLCLTVYRRHSICPCTHTHHTTFCSFTQPFCTYYMPRHTHTTRGGRHTLTISAYSAVLVPCGHGQWFCTTHRYHTHHCTPCCGPPPLPLPAMPCPATLHLYCYCLCLDLPVDDVTGSPTFLNRYCSYVVIPLHWHPGSCHHTPWLVYLPYTGRGIPSLPAGLDDQPGCCLISLDLHTTAGYPLLRFQRFSYRGFLAPPLPVPLILVATPRPDTDHLPVADG